MSPVTLQVGERRFTTLQETLREGSDYFEAHFSGPWKQVKQEDGSIFIDRDGDLFAHILSFQRSGKFPLFYDDVKGFDHDKYVSLLVEAEYFGVDALISWIQAKKYEKVIKLERTGYLKRSVEEIDGIIDADSKPEYFLEWETRKIYLCPRELAKHRGQPNACGRQCRNAQGDSEPEYEDERLLMVVEIRTHKNFHKEHLTA